MFVHILPKYSPLQVIGNYTLLIQPSVPQDVFYDLCGLTLRTIFDLRIPGATTPVKSLLQLAGDAIPSQGTLCPQLNAVKYVLSFPNKIRS